MSSKKKGRTPAQEMEDLAEELAGQFATRSMELKQSKRDYIESLESFITTLEGSRDASHEEAEAEENA